MRVVSIVNYKGGVGKTTVTANLAVGLAMKGFRVLIIDLDPQCSLTFSFVRAEDWESKYKDTKTLRQWYDNFLREQSENSLADFIVRPEEVNRRLNQREIDQLLPSQELQGCVDLVCSHLNLDSTDLALAIRMASKEFLRILASLRNALLNLPAEMYDFILLDCPPNFFPLTRIALVASDFYLLPTKPDSLSTLGIDEFRQKVKSLITVYNKFVEMAGNEALFKPISPKILGILFTMVSLKEKQPEKNQQFYIERLKGRSLPTFQTIMRLNRMLHADAPENGVPAILRHRLHQTQREVQEEIENFVTEFLEMLGE